MLETSLLFIQIILCAFCISMTYRIFKLINHGNMWWVMSLGFILLLIANIFTLFYSSSPWYMQTRTVYLPFFIRIAFFISIFRILIATQREHAYRQAAERAVETNLEKIRELSAKIDNVVVNCPKWDNNLKICEIDKG